MANRDVPEDMEVNYLGEKDNLNLRINQMDAQNNEPLPMCDLVKESDLGELKSLERDEKDPELERIRSGAFGCIFLRDRLDGSTRALMSGHFMYETLKLTRPNVAQMVEEARLIKTADRIPNICFEHPFVLQPRFMLGPSLFLNEVTDILYENAPLGTLYKHVERENTHFVDTTILQFAYQLATAIEYCHQKLKIMHRNINSKSIFVFQAPTGRFYLKLGGFVFARRVSRGDALSANTNRILRFSAPETLQDSSDVAFYSYSSDIWSYGMILDYIAHDGRNPFEELKHRSQLRRALWESDETKKKRPVLRADLHSELVTLIKFCCRSERRDDDGEILPLQAMRPTAVEIRQYLILHGRQNKEDLLAFIQSNAKYCQVHTLQSDRRSLLETNKKKLTENMRLDTVLPFLQAAGAIAATALESIKRYSGLQARQELLKAVEDHGDDAFESLYKSFKFSKQYELAALLQPLIKDGNDNVDPRHCNTLNSNQFSCTDEKPMELTGRLNLPVEGTDGPSAENQLQIWKKNPSNIYRNFSSPKGRCLIINNHTFPNNKRTGTEIDCINAQQLFRELGYKVVVHDDLTAEEMSGELKALAQKRDHGDSLVVLIFTHGGEGVFKGTDGKDVPIDDVLSMFNGHNAPHLAGKPKIFFFQACRGGNSDDGVFVNEKRGTDQETTLIDAGSIISVVPKMREEIHLPIETDFFIGYATAPGYVAHRHVKTGTWFIQAICEIFSRHAKEYDLCEMMTLVNQRICDAKTLKNNQKQSPEWSSRLRKMFYFFPGLSDSSNELSAE